MLSFEYDKIYKYREIKLDVSSVADGNDHLCIFSTNHIFRVEPQHVLVEGWWVSTTYKDDIALCEVTRHQTNALIRRKRKEAHAHLTCFPTPE